MNGAQRRRRRAAALGGGGGGGNPTGLTLDTESLLLDDAFDRADSSVLGGAWVERSGDWAILSQDLVMQSSTNGLICENTAGAAGEMFLQANVQNDAGGYPVIMSRFGWNGGSLNGFQVLGLEDVDLARMYSAVNGVFTQIGADQAVVINVATSYLLQLYVADDLQQAWVNGVSLAGTNTDHNGQNARTIAMRHSRKTAFNPANYWHDVVWTTGKNTIVSGLPTGWKAKVVNASASIVATAVESGGAATIDCSRHGGCSEGVPAGGWPKIIITDSGDTTQFEYTTNPVYPGQSLSAA